MRTDGPEVGVSLSKGVVVPSDADSSQKFHFHVGCQMMLDPRRPDVAGQPFFGQAMLSRYSFLIITDELIRHIFIPQPQSRRRRKALECLEAEHALIEAGIFGEDKPLASGS